MVKSFRIDAVFVKTDSLADTFTSISFLVNFHLEDWYYSMILLCLLLPNNHTPPFHLPTSFPILWLSPSLQPCSFPSNIPIYLHSIPPPLPPLILPPSHSISLHPFSHPIPYPPPLPPSHPLPSPPSQQVCSESPSKDLSTKLHNMSAMFGLYYKRDGRYNKGSEMWASGLCRYLHDAYPALTTQVLKLLTEVCATPWRVCLYGSHVRVHVCGGGVLVLWDKIDS